MRLKPKPGTTISMMIGSRKFISSKNIDLSSPKNVSVS